MFSDFHCSLKKHKKCEILKYCGRFVMTGFIMSIYKLSCQFFLFDANSVDRFKDGKY